MVTSHGDCGGQARNVTSVCCLIFPWRGQKEEGERRQTDSHQHLEHWLQSQSAADTRRVRPDFWESFSEWLSSPSAGDSPPPPHPVLWEVNLEANFAICGLPHAGKTLSWGDLLSLQSDTKKLERGREHEPKNHSKSLANFSMHPPDSTSSTQST